MGATADRRAVIDDEAEEEGAEQSASSQTDDHAHPSVAFARPALGQHYGADGAPVRNPSGKHTGQKRKRSEGFRVAGLAAFLTYAGLEDGELW